LWLKRKTQISRSYVYWTVHHKHKRQRSISTKIRLPTTKKRQSISHQTHTNKRRKFTLTLNSPSLQEKKTTDVVIQQHSRKLLIMDILISETC
jgi:hypothetical protein